jgi:RNA polymerase sigma-70 factor (ECF subfamily)
MTTVSDGGFEGASGSLSPAEILKKIQSLTDGDKTAIMKDARIYARKTPYDHEDLSQEALVRLLGGKRAWPRNVPVREFFRGVLRSIAWEWRIKALTAALEGQDVADDLIVAPETLIFLKAVIRSFDDDPVAQKILITMIEGVRGRELQELSGLSETEYESKRKKIRRRIEKLLGESDLP